MAALNLLRRWRSDAGSQLIEFMLVFPLLFLMIAGIFDFGMMMRTYEVVTNAAREGARVAVLEDYDDADVTLRVNDYLAASGLAGPYLPPDIRTDIVDMGGGTLVEVRRVRVDYFYNFAALPGITALFGGSFTSVSLSGISTMRAELPATVP